MGSSFRIGIRSAADSRFGARAAHARHARARARTAIKTQPFSIAGQNARDAPLSLSKRIRLDIRSKRTRRARRRIEAHASRSQAKTKARRAVSKRTRAGGRVRPTRARRFFPPQKKRLRFDVRYRYHQIEGIYFTDPAKRPRCHPKSPFGFGFAPRATRGLAARGSNRDPKKHVVVINP